MHRRCVLVQRVDPVMCLLTGEGEGWQHTHTHTQPPGMSSTGLVNYCHSVPNTLPPAVIVSHTPPAPPLSQQKQRAAAAASEGTAAPPMFNLCSGFSFPLFPFLLLPDSPSSKHFWLFCFAALQRVIAHDNDHGRLFSLRSPGLCMHAGASITL